MYKELELNTQEGKKKFSFLATGTTAFRYRQVFHEDLMVMLNNLDEIEQGKADTLVGDKLAFIMNAQAEKKDMSKLNMDAFLAWADQFDGAELFLHMQDFITLYIGSRTSASIPKKEDTRPNVK